MYYLSIFVIGILFSLGLGLSGMTDPAKVTGFLNITSDNWDPSLAMVMLGGVVTFFIAQLFIVKHGADMQGQELQLPTNRTIDRRLVTGAALFGIGWGMVGFCPGPAIVASTDINSQHMWVFLMSMTVGMYVYTALDQRFQEQPDGGASLSDSMKPKTAQQSTEQKAQPNLA